MRKYYFRSFSAVLFIFLLLLSPLNNSYSSDKKGQPTLDDVKKYIDGKDFGGEVKKDAPRDLEKDDNLFSGSSGETKQTGRSITFPDADRNDIKRYCEAYTVMAEADDEAGASMVLKDVVNILKEKGYDEGMKKDVANKLNLTGDRKDIWMDHNILIAGGNRDFSDTEVKLIKEALQQLPEAVFKNVRVISAVDVDSKDEDTGFAGRVPSGGVIEMNDFSKKFNKENEGFIHTLLHEIGHTGDKSVDKDAIPILSDKQAAQWEDLWENSTGYADYASQYAQKNIKEDFAETFQEYHKDTKSFFLHAVLTSSRSQRDILLQKFENITQAYRHTGEDGKEYIYEFYVDDYGKIHQKEVPLSHRRINGKIYSLPSYPQTEGMRPPVPFRRVQESTEDIINRELDSITEK
ncbi:MAG: hypothetical protein KKH98_09010 [Spirochaetes bacterium]|nr:hypothetical protein [Spirochaetota bacterium]